jgi:hypothetical protein
MYYFAVPLSARIYYLWTGMALCMLGLYDIGTMIGESKSALEDAVNAMLVAAGVAHAFVHTVHRLDHI